MHQQMTATEFFQFSLFRHGTRNLYHAFDDRVNFGCFSYPEVDAIPATFLQEDETSPIIQVEPYAYGSTVQELPSVLIHAYEVQELQPIVYVIGSPRNVTVIYQQQIVRNPDGTITMPAVDEQEFCTDNTRNCFICCAIATLLSVSSCGCIFHR